ncbi:MAG: SIMPL domain-containing protein [Nitratireductor sp.]
MIRTVLPLAAALSLCAVPAIAADQPSPRIQVSGEGEAALKPDLAVLTLSVMREADSAREAMSAANQAMEAVIAAMKEAGIAARDLQTAGLQINPRYEAKKHADGSQTSEITAYQVANTLSVRVRDIAAVGAVLDQAVTLGVNQGGGILFGNEDPSSALTQARTAAVKDAIAKAGTLATAAGVELGQIIEISEQAYNPRPMPYMARAEMASGAAPVEAGENSYRVQVNVTFGIGPQD